MIQKGYFQRENAFSFQKIKMIENTELETIEEIPLDVVESQVRVEGHLGIYCSKL